MTTGRAVANDASGNSDGTMMTSLVLGIVHELRNPLFAMTATVDALRERADVSALQSHFDVLHSELQRLSSLASDLSALVAQPTRPQSVSLDVVLREAVTQLQTVAEQHGVFLQLRTASDLGEVLVDHVQLAQSLIRLVRFCVCRTPSPGSVWVQAHGATASSARVRILVRDSGPPLTPEQVACALVPFAVRREGRLTIDLAIAAAAIRAFGGAVSVSSEEDASVVFAVELPRGDGQSMTADS